jgi:hypothetical protein
MTRFLCALVVALLFALPAVAQEKQDTLEALKARVEKLEAENAALKKDLAALKQQVETLTKGPAKETKPAPDEEKVKQAGTSFVNDLAQDSLASAYRSTTAAFQKRTERKSFDEMIEKTPQVKFMSTNGIAQPVRVKKITGDKGYEYYYTAYETGAFKPVNISLILVKDGDEWKVDDVEIRLGK